MATTIYFRSSTSGVYDQWSNGDTYANLAGSSVGWMWQPLSASRGAGNYVQTMTTVTGPTNGIETAQHWISPPLAAAVTISGSITFNLRSYELASGNNAAINCRVMRVKGVDSSRVEVHKTVRTTELGTSDATVNWSETPGAGTSFLRGDRILLIPFADDAGTMAAGTVYFGYDGATPGATGDSYVTFTETFSFDTTTPAGSTLYLTTTAAGINPGSATEYEAWTSRGSGVTTSTTNSVTGPTAPIQITNTGGGTTLEWYTKPLQSVTLAGAVLANVRADGIWAQAEPLVWVSICDSDGANPVAWGSGGRPTRITASETAWQFWVTGDEVAIANGNRLRIRVFIDDAYGPTIFSDMVGSYTVNVYYAGTSGGASGDTYLTLPVSVSEYVVAEPAPISVYFLGFA